MVSRRIRGLLCLSLLVGVCFGPHYATAVMVGKPAPDFTLPSTTGGDITLSQFRGEKMVLLEFYSINFGST